MKEFQKGEYLDLGTPYLHDEKNEWKLPDIKRVSNLSNEIWTYQRNLDTALSDYGECIQEYIRIYEELNKIK